MDPRHPELAIARMRELMKQYDRIEADINKATTSAQLGQLEREGGLVIQEICLVAPRIHEAMMQSSRNRRHDLIKWNGNVTRETVMSPLYNVGDAEVAQAKGEGAKRISPVEVVEKYVEPNQAETVIVEPKPRKKKTAKRAE